jgi:uncharacterized protein YndB with AHSA1/START domain
MTAIDDTTPASADSIALELELRHSPQKVWRALTDPELLAQWLLPVVELKLEPGAAFMFKAPSQAEWDGTVRCRDVHAEADRDGHASLARAHRVQASRAEGRARWHSLRLEVDARQARRAAREDHVNITLWVLQILLALHTLMGAGWKLSNSEQAVPSLKAIPHGVWMGLIGVELLCAVALAIPLFNKSWMTAAAIGALGIGAEMLLFSGVHLSSGDKSHGQMIYWLVVFAVCAFIAYGRLVLKP